MSLPNKNTDQKTAELHNKNIYISGLPEAFNDDELHSFGSNYGEVVNLKAIINEVTGKCKGYGFILYKTHEEAQNAINGFVSNGYKASFSK
ncbi:hypothetical protein BB560_005624, partial [Smittium megazygosporum]